MRGSVKKGGPNPSSNTVLAAVLDKAKELDVPKEILERNIKRASEKGQEAYIEKVYEVIVSILSNFIYRLVAIVIVSKIGSSSILLLSGIWLWWS